MSKEFDLFASAESDNLQEELANHSYSWTNKVTWVLLGVLVFVAGASSGVWYAHKTSTSSGASIGAIGANFAAQRGGQGNSNSSGGNAIGAQPGGGQGFGGGGFGRGTAGTIKKIDGTTIELETRDGSTITVKAQSDTRVLSTNSDSFASLKVGDLISVVGQTETDGSITPNAITKGAGLGIGGGRANQSATSAVPAPESSTSISNSPANGNGANKTGKTKKNKRAPAPAISGNPPQGNQGQQGQQGQRTPGNGPGGGGRFNSPELRACLEEQGVTIEEGQRPDLQDPQVAAAFATCREKLGLGNGPRNGPGNGGGNGPGNGGAPAQPPTN